MKYTEISNDEWEEIILKSDNAYFFQSPAWAKIMEKTYNYRTATRLYHLNDKEILIPMMEINVYGLKTFQSMPHGFYGGVFSDSDISTDDFKAIVNDIIGGKNLSFHLETPPFMELSPPDKLTKQIKDERKIKDKWSYTHLINLEGKNFDYIWENNFKQSTRSSIRKAKKSGIKIKDGTSLEDFRDFYNIKWGFESPPYPFNFFRNLHKYGSPHVKLTLAIKDQKTIAGLIAFHYSKTVYYLGSAFLAEYGTFNPPSLLFKDSIKQACQENYKYLNFGPSAELKCGRFKEGFGAEKIEINRYRVYSNLGKILYKINKLRERN